MAESRGVVSSRRGAARTAAALTVLLAFVGLLPLAAAQSAEQANQPSAAVEAAVTDAMSTEGTADFWIMFAAKADLSAAYGISDWAARGQYVYDRLTATATASQAELRADLTARGVQFTGYHIVNAIRVTGGSQAVLDSVRAQAGVAQIVAPRTYAIPEPAAEPTTAPQAIEWGIDNINADEVWNTFGVRGEGIVVANIDTGVQFDHPALVDQYRGNNGDGTFDHNYNWFDAAGSCPTAAPCDNNNHGTHTMGTMVGDDGGANQIGVAPGAQWIAANGCCPSDQALIDSGAWMLAPRDLNDANPDPSRRPHIINNSWGTQVPSNDPFLEDVLINWAAAGIFGMWSNGNNGPGCATSGSPGSRIINYSAGAYDINNVIAGFSSRGPGQDGQIKPNLAAPGVNVRSSITGGGYGNFSGTSMASPHTAGTIALMWSAAPSLMGDTAATKLLLDDTARDVDAAAQCGGTVDDNNVFGEGRLDAFAAVDQSPRGTTGALSGTITDSATSTGIAGATVSLMVGDLPRTATTDADADYSFAALPEGTYDVTASAFGYLSETASATITQGTTTDLDFALASVQNVTVSGTITDGSGHAWALYAKVTVAGTPASTYSSPFTGAYSLTLPAGATYTITTEVQYPGYQTLTETIDVGDGDLVHDIAVPVHPFACRDAPGYAFEAEIAMITSDPGGQFAEYFDSLGADVDFFTVGQIAQVTGYDTVLWGYSATIATQANFQTFLANTDADGAGVVFLDHAFANGNGIKTLSRYTGQPVSVAVSSSGGIGQPNMYEVTQEHEILEGLDVGQQVVHEPGEAGWLAWFTGYEGEGRQIIANAGRSGGAIFGSGIGVDERPNNRHALLSLHSSSATRGPSLWSEESEQIFWNALQWVNPDVTLGCVAVEGGLVAGIVRDDNTNQGVVGATVTSDDAGVSTTTLATPDDPGLPDGFYWMFSALTGRHPFTASADDYVSQTRQVTVAADAVTQANFTLGAGLLTLNRDSVSATVQMGGSASRTFRITNEGTAPAEVELVESGGGFEMLGGTAGAAALRHTDTPAPAASGFGPSGGIGPRDAPLDGSSWATNGAAGSGPRATPIVSLSNAPNAVTITHSASQDVVALNSAACSGGGTTRENGYLRTFVLEDFDITSDFEVTNVSFGIESLSQAQDVTVKLYTLDGELLYANLTLIGSAVASLSPQSLTIVDVPVSGTAPAGSTLVVEIDVPDMPSGRFFVGSNPDGQTAPSYLRSATCGLPEPTPTDEVSFPDMHIVMNVTGETGGAEGLPWLSVNPPSFTLQPGQSVAASVIMDANVDQPGTYTAQIAIGENTPYSVGPVDVTMTVPAPRSWGKITGTVTSLACGGGGGPIEGAVVQIDGLQFDVTLITDEAASYAYWIGAANNPLNMIVAATDHIPQTRMARIVRGQTVVENFTLREIC